MLLVVAPACWAENPLFGMGTETSATTGSSGSSATTGSSATSTDVTAAASSGVTGTATTSSGEAGSEGPGTGEPVSSSEPTGSGGEPGTTTSTTSTGEPGSSGGETTLPGGTTGEPVVCEDPPVNDSLHVEVQKNGVPYTGCMKELQQEHEGILFMNGAQMKLVLSKDCVPVEPAAMLLLVSGLGIPVIADPVCALVTIDWDPEGASCNLELLQVRDVETQNLLYVGAFRLDLYVGFPLYTEAVNVMSCGCPMNMMECCNPEPGILELTPSGGDPVAQYDKGYAEQGGVTYDFYNLQSWIDPDCSEHVDWLAVVVEG